MVEFEEGQELAPGGATSSAVVNHVRRMLKLLGGGGAPAAHAASHQDTGTDEIDVTGLQGVLAEGQLASALLTATGVVVVSGAADPSAGQVLRAIDSSSASWQDAAVPGAHAETHEDGGTDEINVEGLTGLLATPQTPAAHEHSGADITSGTVAPDRLGSGSGGAIKFLREDSTFQKIGLSALDLPYATGSLTVPTESYFVMSRHLKLTTTQRLTLQGTATLRIT